MRVSRSVERWLTARASDPSVRARYWTEVAGRSATEPAVRNARGQIGKVGWAASILDWAWPDGHFVTPGTKELDLYLPKYVVTNWQAIVLADLGMTRADPRVRRIAELILDRWGGPNGDLSGKVGEVCVTGNAVRTLVRFGYGHHPTVRRSIDYLVRTQLSDGGWHCRRTARSGTLDGWEALAAFAEIPEADRDAPLRRSIERGAEFYLQRRLMEMPGGRYDPWFRLHYPNHYFYDLLVGLRILTRLGYGADPRLRPALAWLRSKRRSDGTWALDANHPDIDPKRAGYQYTRIHFPMVIEPAGDPSRWATVEALSVLRRAEQAGTGR